MVQTGVMTFNLLNENLYCPQWQKHNVQYGFIIFLESSVRGIYREIHLTFTSKGRFKHNVNRALNLSLDLFIKEPSIFLTNSWWINWYIQIHCHVARSSFSWASIFCQISTLLYSYVSPVIISAMAITLIVLLPSAQHITNKSIPPVISPIQHITAAKKD